MAYALVGTIGAVSQGAAGAAVTPVWGTGESRTINNLLVCWVSVNGSATIAGTPSGWSMAVTKAGTSTSVAIFYKIAAGTDAAPTIAAISSGVIAVQLGEFSGNLSSSPVDQIGSAASTSSPLVSTAGGVDAQIDELIITTNTAYYSKAATKTLTDNVNNATAVITNNASTSTASHYDFTYGFSTANASADSDSWTFATLKITGSAGAIASFKLPVTAPTVTTQAVSNITDTTATANGTIVDNGGAVLTEKGICYMTGTSGDPTTANSKFYDTINSIGAFTESMTGLSATTNYRVRAYAINSIGTSYGLTVQLTTSLPSVVANGQYGADRVTPIAVGGATGTAGYTTKLYQEFLMHLSDPTLATIPKVENKQIGTAFSNIATTTGTSLYLKANDLPTMRRGAALTYDSINKRYINCGGYNGTIRFNDLWALSYYGDNTRVRWRKLAPTGTPPSQINMAASTQLNANGKSWFIYWGGSLSSGQSNTMLIADCTTPGSETWTTPAQTNTPSIRSYINQHMTSVSTGANTYDVYLFGGWNGSGARYNDLMRCSFDLSGTVPTAITWTTVTADGAVGSPSQRQGGILVYDSANNRLVLFSGYDGTSYLADLWAFNISSSTWTQLTPTGTTPIGREAGNGAYDVVNQRMVIFNGWSAGTLASNLNDIVSISLVSGSESFTTIRANDTTNNSFQRASNGSACLDTDKRLIVQYFQGGVDLTTKYGYAFDLDEGRTTDATMYGVSVVDTFRARDAPAYCVDTTRNKGLLICGYGTMDDDTTIANGDHMNEVWSYDYSTNVLRYVNSDILGLYYREGAQACYDSINDRIIIFGGLTALGQVTNDVWELKPDIFGNYKARRMLPTGTIPGSRWLSVIAFDAVFNRVVIWSGSSSGSSLIANTDMWILDLSGGGDGAWSSVSASGTPPPAMWQTMYAYKASNNRLYIFSGCTDTGQTTFSTSTYYLDLTGAIPAWVQPTTTSTVGVRGGVMAYDATNNYLIAFSGYDGTASNNTLSFLNLATDTNNWATVTPGGTIPGARRSAVAWFLNGKFYVCAGRTDSSTWYSDVYELTPDYTTPSNSTWANKSPSDYQPVTTATTGLTNNANYHWQSWATISSVDTAFSSFGSNSESATDFTIGTVGTTGIKVWNGSSWAYKPLNVWNGTSWVAKPIKVWNGTSWVTKG